VTFTLIHSRWATQDTPSSGASREWESSLPNPFPTKVEASPLPCDGTEEIAELFHPPGAAGSDS
jgi:hypothetical protein